MPLTHIQKAASMALTTTNSADTRSSVMSFDKSTVVVWVAISLILVETFSGALRFYFDQAGISPLLYMPKAACILLFVLELCTFKAGRLFWAFMVVWMISGLLAMLHRASVHNLAFSLFALSPLVFGLVCSKHLLYRRTLLYCAIGFCLLASLLGIALDKYTSVPWKGYSYSVGETELSANTTWSADEVDRIAGFARVSNVLSIMIAFYTLYLIIFVRSRLMMMLLSAVALYAIVLTTSKAPAAAFALTLILLLLRRMSWTCRTLCIVVVGIGLLLPTLGLIVSPDAYAVSSGGSLASLYDRMINTWPNLINAMSREGWMISGAGFGMVGSTMGLFPVEGAGVFLGMDSSALYLWAMLGVLGLLLYALQIPLLFRLIDDQTRIGHMLLAISFCWCLISWTTDMFEVAVANLFIGVAIGHVIASRQSAASHALRLPATDR
ncbi:O-antigen ligase-like membrane protein [Pseudomonas savastanoi]|uniref:O-antigen ligase-like membrane protein n=2 Tax=Pseudomonas syringae group TaxID=136849 RepID=A0A3M5FNY5_PSESS|nr:O-antigen ligase-like membrane protein [Pseudomonas savastanoi]